jgi:hypothetical protein
VRVKFWRYPAASVPATEEERIAWLYERWQILDDWVGEQRAALGGRRGAAPKVASPTAQN